MFNMVNHNVNVHIHAKKKKQRKKMDNKKHTTVTSNISAHSFEYNTVKSK